MRNQEGIKIELQKKVYRRICVRDVTVLTTRLSFFLSFFAPENCACVCVCVGGGEGGGWLAFPFLDGPVELN